MAPRKKTPKIPPSGDPESLGAWMLRYLEWLRIRNYSEATLRHRESHLGDFLVWCNERGLSRPAEITRPMLLRFQRHLFYYRKANGEPLSVQSQHSALVAVRSYFKWVVRQGALLYNPASELELPKLEKRLPKHVLSPAEVDLVMAQPNLEDALGVRDRAILETFYSTGMRRKELLGLKVFDLDAGRGTVMIRQGKGKKDRMVPIGERAVAWVQKYIHEVRPRLVLEPDDGTLFLGIQGDPFTLDACSVLVAGYVERAELGKRGSCHLLRHSCATAMLEGGADVRFIQELLGHVSLATTQIYTQVSIKKLKAIHSATHPSAKLERAAPSDPEASSDSTSDPEQGPEAGAPPGPASVEEEGRWPQKRLWSYRKNR